MYYLFRRYCYFFFIVGDSALLYYFVYWMLIFEKLFKNGLVAHAAASKSHEDIAVDKSALISQLTWNHSVEN